MTQVERFVFGELPDGRAVDAFALRTAAGAEAVVIAYGASVSSLRVPDRDGRLGQVVLGFDTLEPYLGGHPFFGATVGRFANRIAGARFSLDGQVFALPANDGLHHLHGGPDGFGRRLWSANVAAPDAVRLRLHSQDGDGGYPGALDVQVVYRFTESNELRIEFGARAERTTVVNLTHHSYFNLRDGGEGDVLGHTLEIGADRYTPTDADGIPTGAVEPVEDTPLDFRQRRPIGERLSDLERGWGARGGYDHNLVLCSSPAARLHDPESGRVMLVRTSQPGLQLYAGHKLDHTTEALGGRGARFGPHAGVCLETQHFPDAPNHPEFPGTRLDPGSVYAHFASYRFETDRPAESF